MRCIQRRWFAGLLAFVVSLALMVVGAMPAAAAEAARSAPAVVYQSTSAQIMSAPTSVSVSCEFISQWEPICFVSYSSATPVEIKWFFNGVHHPWYDNSQFAHPPCDGGFTGVQVVVSNAHGSASAFRNLRCPALS